jgi:hypothetical protein
MTSFGQGNNQSKSVTQKPANSFAGSLLENEQKNANLSTNDHNEKVVNPFANALLNSSGANRNISTPESLLKQQEETLFQQKKEALRKKLHDKVNPVNTHELFSAREEKSKEELNQIRKELELLIADIKGFNQDIEIVVAQDVVAPGSEGGSYYQNFFFQLRQFIMLLRQKVSSARSWAQQMQAKSKKQYGLNYKKTKDVHASMNNERNAGANAAG